MTTQKNITTPKAKITIIIFSIFTAVATTLAIVFGCLWLTTKPDNKYSVYGLQLDDTSKQSLDNGIWSSSEYDIQAMIYTNDHLPSQIIYDCTIDTGDSYCEIQQSEVDGSIFTIDTMDWGELPNPYVEVEATLSAELLGLTLTYDFFFTIYPIESEYTADSIITIAGQTTTSSNYDTFSESAIGNIPVYTLVGSNLKDDGSSVDDFYARVTSTNVDCFRIIENQEINSYSIQVLDQGSSVISIDYYENGNPRSLWHVQKTWTLDSTDIANSAVFSHNVIDSVIPYRSQAVNDGNTCEYSISLNGYVVEADYYKNLIYTSHTDNQRKGYVTVDPASTIIEFHGNTSGLSSVSLTATTSSNILFNVLPGQNNETHWWIQKYQ